MYVSTETKGETMSLISTNLNKRSEAYKNAAPRLQAGLDNIADRHAASGMVKLKVYDGQSNAVVLVQYRSGACLRDVVTYLDEMQVLD